MTYLEKPKTFLEELGNASRWGVWFAIVASLVTTLCYIDYITDNVHIIFISTIIAIWASVYAGMALKMEMP